MASFAASSNPYVEAVVAFARDVAMNGVGEGEPAHGFAITLCDGAKMMRVDSNGDAEFGERACGLDVTMNDLAPLQLVEWKSFLKDCGYHITTSNDFDCLFAWFRSPHFLKHYKFDESGHIVPLEDYRRPGSWLYNHVRNGRGS